ncbi:hypothetical protein [Salinispora arenicola]|nr:hypothetical protein [Salinispora arenicola]
MPAVERSGRSARIGDSVFGAEGLSLWEQMLSAQNLGRALKRVESNRGAPGVDGLATHELRGWLRQHWGQVRAALDAGTYQPQPVRRVVIP